MAGVSGHAQHGKKSGTAEVIRLCLLVEAKAFFIVAKEKRL